MRKRVIRWMLAAVLLAPLTAWAGPSQHTVSVTLNYDFTVDNGCSTTVTNGCVKQFNIYDITGGGTPVNSSRSALRAGRTPR